MKYFKKGWVYVASHPNADAVKVGISKYVDERVKSFRNAQGQSASIYYTCQATDVYRIEMIAHRMLRKWKVEGEWFSCSPAMAAIAVDRARQFWITSRSDYTKLYCRLATQDQLDRIGKLIQAENEIRHLEWKLRATELRASRLRQAIQMAERKHGKITVRVKARYAA